MNGRLCRFCGAPLEQTVIDLGHQPLSNAYRDPSALFEPEPRFPLHARVCGSCFLVQIDDVERAEHIFTTDYAYFSSFADSWVAHAKRYAAAMITRFALEPDARIVEAASNDGYLLRHFKEAGRVVLGVEPAANAAAAARKVSVPSEVAFFGRETAQRLAAAGKTADLMAANNVLAHVPDVNDFVSGFAILLKPDGVVTFEFPELRTLIEGLQFDTIYHEHFSYLSFTSAKAIMEAKGLRVFEVEALSTHGGSLRVFAHRADGPARSVEVAVKDRLQEEADFGLNDLNRYEAFRQDVDALRSDVRAYLDDCQLKGFKVAAYGAAAKGNTFLNYCGLGVNRINCVADRNPHKQGKLTPGGHIPILSPQAMLAQKPDRIIILPWNIIDEVADQLAEVRNWGGRLVTLVPRVEERT